MLGARNYLVIGAALLLAIPIVSFVSGLVVFPILFYGLVAIVANAGLPLVLVAGGLRSLGVTIGSPRLFEGWARCSVLWLGCAYGLAHWGDAGATMGARNIPYLHVLFAPYRYLLGYPVG